MLNDWQNKSKEKWDKQAISWDSRSLNMWENGSRKDIIPFFKKHISLMSTVIDIGCGSGYGSYKLSENGYQVTGIDISTEMIDIAKVKLENQSIPLHVGEVDSLPFEDESFQSALLINVIEWTKNPAKSLTEIKRVLTKNGYLCAGILGATAGPRANSYPRLYGKDVIMNTMMPWEFFELAREHGFKLIEQKPVYKTGINIESVAHLDDNLKQAISFMTLFMLQKGDEQDE